MKLPELHDHLFDLLCVIDDICKKENVRYFLDSGTELGAVREKDFIPWDDDMDLKVLSEDYPAFKAAMEKNLPEHMHIIEPDAFAPGFHDFIVRIYDDRYLIREETEEDRFYKNYANRVSADVFIFAKAPANPLAQKWMSAKIKALYGMGMRYRYKINYDNKSFVEKVFIRLFSFMGRWTTPTKLWKKFYALVMANNNKPTEYRLCSNYQPAHLYFMKNAWVETSSQGEIRGRKFPISGDYDALLTFAYGDYMSPPKNLNDFIHHLDEQDAWKG